MRLMNIIKLDNMIPKVFASEPPEESEVWLRRVELCRGERILVEARSGAGKTSLASFIMGLRNDYNGRLLFDDRDSATFSADDWADLRSRTIAYLPQNLDLFLDLTAADNIRVKLQLTEDGSGLPEGYLPFDFEAGARRLGVDRWLDKPAGKLSVGQMQRVAILRALAQPFDFLILDEPVSHLDDANNLAAAELIGETADRQGAAVIVLSVGNRLHLPYSRTLLL